MIAIKAGVAATHAMAATTCKTMVREPFDQRQKDGTVHGARGGSTVRDG